MSLSRYVLHVIPLQISLSGATANILCADPRVRLVEGTLVFTFNPPNPRDPPAPRRVCFVVADPLDAGGYDNYFNLFSAPPLDKLVPWKRSGTLSRSPELPAGHKFDIVAVAYSVPQQGTQASAAAKTGHGRRRFEITDSGGEGGLF